MLIVLMTGKVIFIAAVMFIMGGSGGPLFFWQSPKSLFLA